MIAVRFVLVFSILLVCEAVSPGLVHRLGWAWILPLASILILMDLIEMGNFLPHSRDV